MQKELKCNECGNKITFTIKSFKDSSRTYTANGGNINPTNEENEYIIICGNCEKEIHYTIE